MTYAEALEYLEGLGRFGLRPGLDTVRALAARCGNPETRLSFLHVAGTNGKGSTCAFLESVCRAAGFRVGLYTSPHLVSFRERIQVDRVPIPESAVVEGLARAREWVSEAGGWREAPPTFFEMVTVLALDWFEKQRCDLVIWETGLGGRLDATNLVTPRVSVITNIGWDHMEWLGPTLTDIAREKAGIIKHGVPVVTAEQSPEVLAVLRGVAESREAPFRPVTSTDEAWEEAVSVPLGLQGGHQRWNAALALAALDAAGLGDRVGRGARRRGLETARWAGRFEVVRDGAGTLVLDGAHNAPGFEALASAMSEVFPGRRYGLLLGMLADKVPGDGGLKLARGASRIVVVRVASNRAGDPEALARWLRGEQGVREVETASGWTEGRRRLADEPLVVVAGSLYLIGEALDSLARSGDGPSRGRGEDAGGESKGERHLNDWSPRR